MNVGKPMKVVVKIGSSSLTDESGIVSNDAINKITFEIADLHEQGHQVVLVTSGAIAAGLPLLGFEHARPRDVLTLQAAAGVGQVQLIRRYDDAFAKRAITCGQLLLSPSDFFDRRQYLHARDTLNRLLALGCVPIVNENDAVADDEIRFGDNDRLAALVAHLIDADMLVLLTDTAGVYTADPRSDSAASLIEEVQQVDALFNVAGGAGSARGSGGMASKVAAAKMASWSGVLTVIAGAQRANVLSDAVDGVENKAVVGVGTVVRPRALRLGARKLWIAFALEPKGTLIIDQGARSALVEAKRSLLPAGVVKVEGDFDSDSAVEVRDETGNVVARGLVRYSSGEIRQGAADEIINRDDLVIMQ